MRADARSCPHCGSDAETGWAPADEIEYRSVEIPDFWGDGGEAPSRFAWDPKTILIVAGVALALLAALRIAF